MTTHNHPDQPEQRKAGDKAQRTQRSSGNTPEHGVAVLHLLNREPLADYVRESTERISTVEVVAEPGTQSVVIFRSGGEWLALPTGLVQEVTDARSIHTIPHHRNEILMGLVSVRGELLVCASLNAVLGLEKVPEREDGKSNATRERLLVMSRGSSRLAFPVDEVYGVHRYHPRELKDVPATLSRAAATYTIGLLNWQDQTVGCLDDELLFYTLDKSLS